MTKKNVNKRNVDLDDADYEKDQPVMATKDLEKLLDSVNEKITDLAMYGSTPDLLKLSWENYELFKKGLLPKYFGDSEDELQEFYDNKSRELVLKLMTFIDVASTSLVDESKLKEATLREVTASIKLAMDMVGSIVGAEKVIKHEVEHVVSLTEEELDKKIKEAKDKLNTIDAEFEASEPPDDSTNF